ncbi:hypothetical protein V6N13_144306 [Hibiscus sabdariffa]
MERNDLYQVSNSFRASTSSRWRDTGFNVFSTSFRQESGGDDDEEALKWAAIERLPRFARVRKALLTTSDGETREVDVPKLGHQERKNLMDRVGIEIPKLEVRYQNLRVEAEAYVGSRALPSFFNFFINKLESILHTFHLLSSRKKHVHILRDVSGIIRPCRMTLLLGPPSSGKTTLLLALAGKLDRDLKFSGRVTYNGQEMNDFVAQRTAAYIGQNDIHTPELTVRETIAFSARCQGVGPRYEMLAELARREKAANIKPDPDIDVFMKVKCWLVQQNCCSWMRSSGLSRANGISAYHLSGLRLSTFDSRPDPATMKPPCTWLPFSLYPFDRFFVRFSTLDEFQRVTSVPQSNEDDDRSEVDAQFPRKGSNTDYLCSRYAAGNESPRSD